MRTKIASFGAALAALGILATSGVASASSHREAPGIAEDPVADSTDLWAWNTGNATNGTLHLVVSYNPMEEPSGGPNFHSFGDDVLYEIHVARGSGSLEDVVTYQLRFNTSKVVTPTVPAPGLGADPATLPKPPAAGGQEFFVQLSGRKQTYSLTEVKGGTATVLAQNVEVAPANIGPRTNAVAYGIGGTKADYETFALSKGTTFSYGGGMAKLWAGPRDDGFYVDLGGVFDLANLRAKGAAQDGVAGFNTHTIALDVPFAAIPSTNVPDDTFKNRLGIWTSASRRKMSVMRNDGSKQTFGPWVQVSRLGLPLINEVIVGLQDKDKFSRTQPKDDVNNFGPYILNPILVRDAEAVGIYAGTPQADIDMLKHDRVDIVTAINILSNPLEQGGFPLAATGDVLRVDFNATAGFPNGRPLGPTANGGAANKENDVTDVLSTIVLTGLANFAAKGAAIKDNVDYNDANYTDTFPYLATPWTGYNEGHGKPTP